MLATDWTNVGYRLDECWLQTEDVGYRLRNVGYRLRDVGYRLRNVGYRLRITWSTLFNHNGKKTQMYANTLYTDKKENQIFLIYKEIQKWSSCKVLYEERFPYI
jgi:GT2 family glycosyltransferase